MTTIRMGGVPEHFNAPWAMATDRGLFADSSFRVAWSEHPGGTGEMLDALHAGELDVAILLTEGVVADYARRKSTVAIGTWVETPLQWGIHTRPGGEVTERGDVVGRRFAISRRTSGSHLMAILLVDSLKADPSDIHFVEVGTIDGARQAFERGEADVFMWERTMTKPLVDAGEFGFVGTFQAPWPAFTFACAESKAAELAVALPELLSVVRPLCQQLRGHPESGAETLAERFEIPRLELQEWLERTTWNPTSEVDIDALRDAALALRRAGAIDAVPDLSGLVRR